MANPKPKKLRFLCTSFSSESLKRVAEGLSTKLGYQVLRSKKTWPNRTIFKYGDAVDKIAQYKWLVEKGINALVFTTEREEAKTWAAEGCAIVCRTLVQSSEGKGIVIAETPEEVCEAKVFTKYKKKKREFRVHIFKDKVVHVLEKRRKTDWEGDKSDAKIRNLANGYVFCSTDVVEPNGLRELALSASAVTSSDFRGVDIGYNEYNDELFVIEVNSAPGIEGSNVDRYVEAILEAAQ